MADGCQHPTHLPVSALVDSQLHLALARAVYVLLAAQQADIFGGAGQAVFEHDPLPQARQGIGIGDALHLHPVRFGDMVARVGQLEQEVTIIGQEDQPVAVGVQAAHGPQHRLAANIHEVRHQPPRVGIGA